MNWFRQTNSWHWLFIALLVCLPIAGYSSHLVWKKMAQENGPKIQGMQSHADALVLLQEEDALLLEHQASEIQRRIVAYEAAVRQQSGQPIPEGARSVGVLSNEISRALQKHDLRVVEQEQVEVIEVEVPKAGRAVPAASPEMTRARAAQAAAAREAEQNSPKLPYHTREIRFVVEGEYKQMFMFLVRQSHLKPSYHFKGIRILPSPQHYGMRMEFTVQIHFT